MCRGDVPEINVGQDSQIDGSQVVHVHGPFLDHFRQTGDNFIRQRERPSTDEDAAMLAPAFLPGPEPTVGVRIDVLVAFDDHLVLVWVCAATSSLEDTSD